MALISTPLFPGALSPAIKKYFVDGYKEADAMLEKVLNVETLGEQGEQDLNITGLGGVPLVSEGAVISEDSPIEGYGTTYTAVKNASTSAITVEMELFSRTKEMLNMGKMQGKSAAIEIGQSGFGLFNHGFDTAYTSFGDALPLFSTAHLRADGGAAQSNASATGLALTEANLETAMLAMEQILNDRGKPVRTFASKLIVPPALRKTAIEITKSTKKSGTADNDVNAYSVTGYDGLAISNVQVCRYLASHMGGSDTAWFLMSDDNPLNWKWAQKPRFDRDTSVGFKNLTTVFRVYYLAAKGWGQPMGRIYGSKGDGQVYAS